ncbi:MAG: GGDEF domain-containing protein [Firmicutes bacterium]|nr:GGDEF domain-containing protein [Bacillota bacterium]
MGEKWQMGNPCKLRCLGWPRLGGGLGVAFAAVIAMREWSNPSLGALWMGVGLDLLLLVAFLFALRKIIRVHLSASWRNQAQSDRVTGLAASGAFWVLTENQADSRRNWPWVIAYCDVDNFNHLIEQKGANTGEAVMRAWAEILCQSARQGDVLGRFEDNRVGWWFPNTTAAEAQRTVEQVLAICRAQARPNCPGFTFSVGMATGDSGDTVWMVAQMALQALHQAKRRGQGHVVVWSG